MHLSIGFEFLSIESARLSMRFEFLSDRFEFLSVRSSLLSIQTAPVSCRLSIYLCKPLSVRQSMDAQDFEDLTESIRQRADATLTRRLQDPQRLSPGSLVRVLFPVIEKHLAAGLTLEDIAAALRDDGFAIKRTHLVRHLGIIHAENGLSPLQRGVKSAPQPQGAKKDAGVAHPAVHASPPPPAPAVKQAPAPAPASPSAPPSPVPFPDIPRGELTHTERAEIAKKWIDAQFGGRHPTQVKPDELSPEAQVWLEKLWDKSAPVDPKTGQPYAFKRLTGDGRPTYDEPWWPPEAVPMENSEKGYLPVHDAQARDRIKKYGLTLRADGNNVVVFDKNGKYQVGGIRHDDTACLARSLRDIDYSIQEQIRNGIPY
ncbi:MAG: hypothetical protein J0I24_09455 [Thiomonas arsenitoxydans]|uniref:Uncharacterized protein n=1 Tax=Thiomonas arsenitoxydans (strain DSM 22701 / CIP 110005 / 3As) TaxID=426114 RepID=A0A8I1MX06_THIA3|nr:MULTISPECIES: hypothetical protein [Thiomonas]MBN8744520.1 hypothetical protein [Thiomonas arsenitoxydans]ODU96991.1 MAG: hypothetical protein ABT24_06820 [Thiomonas sp. SCN 64-16]